MDNTFNFMKTGMNLLETEKTDRDLLINVMSIVMALINKAMVSAKHYVNKSKRTVISKKDIKLCLMKEVIVFLQESSSDKLINKWKTIIEEDFSNEEESSEDISNKEELSEDISDKEELQNEYIVNDDIIEDFTYSKCSCQDCYLINKVEEEWKEWKPISPLEKIMKKVINNMNND